MRPQATSRARLVIVLVLLGVAISVVWGLFQAPSPPKPTPSAPGPKPGGERAFSASFVRLLGERETVRFDHADQVVKKDGTIVLKARPGEGPARVTLAYTARGQADTLTIEAQRHVFRPEEEFFLAEGGVRMATGLGLSIETDAVTYKGRQGVAESDAEVAFARKQITGRSQGLRFDVRLGKIEFPKDVRLTIADELRGPIQIHARQASFVKESGAFELLGEVEARQGPTELRADRLVAQLLLPDYALKNLIATGNVRLSSQGAQLTRQAGLKASPGRYQLVCKRVTIALRADGSPESMVAGPEGARFAWWPASQQGRERRGLEAAGAIFFFDKDGHIERVTAHKDVRLTREALKSPGSRQQAALLDTLTCGSLMTVLDPKSGEMTFGEFDRGVNLEREHDRAVAERAVYEDSEFLLTGSPEVNDDRAGSRLVAKTIRVGVGPKQGRLLAQGSVRHTIKRPGGRGLLGSGEVVVTSSYMSYNAAMQGAMYRGDAVLRAGEDEIRAYQIQLRGAEGQRRLVASRRVQMVMRGGTKDSTQDGVLRAGAFRVTYDENEGRLTYWKQVEFSRGELSVRTPESLVALIDGTNAIRSFTAGETEVAVDLGGRKGQGSQLTYTAEGDKIRLTGRPGRQAVLTDADGRGLKGLSLTLGGGEDTILVEGMDIQRTTMTIKRGPTKP